jgi:beta-glucosidase/6-phospho-beta-glucosidase/beta-galactosidase
MIETKPEDLAIIKKVKIDFLGINFYFPSRVQAPSNEQIKNATNLFDQVCADYK